MGASSDLKSGVKRGIVETIEWCTAVNTEDPNHRLRSSVLRPPVDLFNSADLSETVNYVVSHRSKILRERHQDLIAPEIKSGKLLCFYPLNSLADGAAEQESDGFFNTYNDPPWDCWSCLLIEPGSSAVSDSGVLVSWVPGRLVNKVNEGIRANPEGCLEWAQDSVNPFVQFTLSEFLVL
jgi:hypothetical protein